MDDSTRVMLETSMGPIYGVVVGSGFIPGEVKVRWDSDDEVTYIQASRLEGVKDFSDTPEHHLAMAERAVDDAIQAVAAIQTTMALSPEWKVLDAAAEIAAILEKRNLCPQDRKTVLARVTQWANLSCDMQEAAE